MPLMNPRVENLPEPFLGRVLIEMIHDDVQDYLKEKAGIGKDSLIQLPEAVTANLAVPMVRGKVIRKAPDAFGDCYQTKFGKDGAKAPEVGDVVFFINNSSYQLDIENKYHMISDEDVVGVQRC